MATKIYKNYLVEYSDNYEQYRNVLDYFKQGRTGQVSTNSDRQPEVSVWPPKPEVVISLELRQIASKFQRQIRDFQ